MIQPKKLSNHEENGRKTALKSILKRISDYYYFDRNITSQVCGIDVQGNSTWLTLIQNAKFNSSKMRGGELNGL